MQDSFIFFTWLPTNQIRLSSPCLELALSPQLIPERKTKGNKKQVNIAFSSQMDRQKFHLPCMRSSLNPLLGLNRSGGRCWAAIQLSRYPRTIGARPCSQWRGRLIGYWRTTWSTVCSFASHSQAADEAIRHLFKQERNRPTPYCTCTQSRRHGRILWA